MPVGAPEGNQNAVKENRWWTNTLRRALAQQDGEVIRKLAEKLIEKASEGDVAALREIGDRIDGKPTQALEHSGPDGGVIPLPREVTFNLVKPDA
jgi:hypothetical protein